MLRSAQNCKSYTFLNNLRTITQDVSMGTRQMTPFYLLFTLFVTFISEFENTQNTFFGQNLLICTAHHTLQSRHPEVTENLYYVLSIRWSQIPRTYSSCFMHVMFTHMRLPFFKKFWYFYRFCPFFWKILCMPLLSRIGPEYLFF